MSNKSNKNECIQRRRRVWRFRRGPGEFVISGCLDPYPLYRENSHRIFTFCMNPTGQLRGVRTPGPPGQLRRWMYHSPMRQSVDNTTIVWWKLPWHITVCLLHDCKPSLSRLNVNITRPMLVKSLFTHNVQQKQKSLLDRYNMLWNNFLSVAVKLAKLSTLRTAVTNSKLD